MEIYLLIVVVLFIAAISDLVVGVGNDAVNFLNSAIGSKIAPRHIILIIASIGVLVGTLFSSGMMEVARSGIFQPDKFYLSEVMVIFLAVMITDVLLLDLFNTFGLPTSTTVSLVFELIGSSVAVSIIKIINTDGNFGHIVEYINTAKALAIISGILVSVVVAFTVGSLVQYLTRLIFSFNYKKTMQYFGAIWGSIAITSIVYFILIKGSKGTSFLTKDMVKTISDNAFSILFYNFLFWTIVFQILISFLKVNIFKGIILAGTFALALAFAANDLVNFIGVPMAGFSSYLEGLKSADPSTLLMGALKEPVQTATFFLALAGIIMILTLWFNKKARTVTKTEVSLGRQSEGFERFESSMIARVIVRMAVTFSKNVKKVIPQNIQNFIDSRFNKAELILEKDAQGERASFDVIRAANNLVISSMLISYGTAYKLPLSTTYVTFMVAMATSLADRSWGRQSAVYRVNGVITVIGGWFITAFFAFTSAFLLAFALYYGEVYAIIGLVLLACFILYRTHILHKERTEEEEEDSVHQEVKTKNEALNILVKEVVEFLTQVPVIYNNMLNGFSSEDRNSLGTVKKEAKKFRKRSNFITNHILRSIEFFKEEEIKAGKRFGKVIASLQEISNKLISLTNLCFNHIDNNHHPLTEKQIEELKLIASLVQSEVDNAILIIKEKSFDRLEEYQHKFDELVVQIAEFDNNQVTRIKQDEDTARNSMLYLNILSDTEDISNHIGRLINTMKNTVKSISI